MALSLHEPQRNGLYFRLRFHPSVCRALQIKRLEFHDRTASSVTVKDSVRPAASWWRVAARPNDHLRVIYVGNSPTVSAVLPTRPDTWKLSPENSDDFGNDDVHMYRVYICMEAANTNPSNRNPMSSGEYFASIHDGNGNFLFPYFELSRQKKGSTADANFPFFFSSSNSQSALLSFNVITLERDRTARKLISLHGLIRIALNPPWKRVEDTSRAHLCHNRIHWRINLPFQRALSTLISFKFQSNLIINHKLSYSNKIQSRTKTF